MKPTLTMGMLVLLSAPATAMAQNAGAVTATEIDPQAYTGTWYEVARTPAPFQDKCDGGVTATYNLVDTTTMQVVNRCDLPDGETQEVTGQAQVVDGNFNTFSVQIGDAQATPGINYVVAAASDVTDGSYQWAAVHAPDENIGWILSRSPELEAEAREKAETALQEAGVDVSQLSDTPQPPDTYQPQGQ